MSPVESLPTLVLLADAPTQAWRNGGGVTRELLAFPTAADWKARVSVADIDGAGPFSSLPGVTRWFGVLSGAGVELTVDGKARRITAADEAFAFAGQACTECRLLCGPTRDLNLMLRGASGSMQRARPGQAWRPTAGACGLYAAVSGQCTADATCTTMPAGSLLWFNQAPTELRFDTTAPFSGIAGWWLHTCLAGVSA